MNITKFEREMLILERDVEKRFKRRVEKSVEGALCWKFVSPGQSGVPDRIVILPHGLMMWVELKRPGAEPRPTQMAR